MRHNQILWPLVVVQRDEDNRLSHCAIRWAATPPLTPLTAIPRPSGHAVHLILSGPSIADIDYEKISIESAMGVNGSIALLEKFPRLEFSYYAMLDAGFVCRRKELVAEVLARNLLLFVTPEVLRWITLLFPAQAIRCRIAVFEEVHHRANLARPSPAQLLNDLQNNPDLILFDAHNSEHAHGFSLDVTRGVFGGGTVAYTALQFLTWLGFQEIYLHGLDLRNANNLPLFYEDPNARLSTALERQFAGHIEPAFRRASLLLQSRGVKVYNLPPDSALDTEIFQKIHWTQLCKTEDTDVVS